MNIENLNNALVGFYNAMVASPVDFGVLVLLLVSVFFVCRAASGNASREKWYKEKKLQAKQKVQVLEPADQRFLKRRIYFRFCYWSTTLLLACCLPFTYLFLLDNIDKYWPVLIEHWYVLVGGYVIYRVLRMLNSIMNLQLLSKEVENVRKKQ